jgi:predicted amidohydrolase YtcJ
VSTIFYNGNILTGRELETDKPERVSAVAVGGGSIVYVGTDQGAFGLCDVVGEKIDLHGAFVMPGFNDAHTHMAFAGQQKLTVDLDNVASLAAMQAKVKAYAAGLSAGQWITGGGWDHTKWASKTLPAAKDLDAVTGGHPAYLERTDGHIAVLNSAALKAAGITGETKAPEGGAIDLDAVTHQPTGIVRDAALALARPAIPRPDAAMRRRALTIAMEDAVAHGVTSVQDYSDWDDFLVMEQMEKDGKLPVRVSEWLTFNDPIDVLKEHRAHHDAKDPMLHTGMLKGFMDGSLGSRTAAMLEPYSDDAKNSGLPRYEQKTLDSMAGGRAQLGFQLGFHAIGDEANNMALNAMESAQVVVQNLFILRAREEIRKAGPKNGQILMERDAAEARSGLRNRIEHAQVLLPGDFDRFEEMHIVASMQPSHLLTDMAWAGDRLGPERSKYAYAWRSMLDHHVMLAFGTDYPVESVSPFRGLYSAVTRMNEAGTQTFHPEQKLTMGEAIFAYTQGSAFAQFDEGRKGILVPGFLADLVVLDRDITKVSPKEVLHTVVLRTVVGGVTRYVAAPRAAEGVHRNVVDGD